MKEARKAAGYTQQQVADIMLLSKRNFAKLIGVSAMSVSDWTTGKVQPTAENIYLTAKYFKVSCDYLLGLEDEFEVKLYS